MSKHNRNRAHDEQMESTVESQTADTANAAPQAESANETIVEDTVVTEEQATTAVETPAADVVQISADELAELRRLKEEDAKRKAKASAASKTSRQNRLAKETPEEAQLRKDKAKKASATSNAKRKAEIEEMKRKLAAFESGQLQVAA